MHMLEVKSMLMELRVARERWGKGRTEFFSGYDWVLTRLVHEGAKNYMSDRDMANALGVGVKVIRTKMRAIGLDPRAGKRTLSSRASQAMLENAAIMGIEPDMMDLTSPLAYLPMGEQMRKAYQEKTVSQVTELEFGQDDDPEMLANRIYEEMPWEGATYEAVAERLASVLVNEGWHTVSGNTTAEDAWDLWCTRVGSDYRTPSHRKTFIEAFNQGRLT